MKFTYKGKNIFPDTSVNSCYHTMHSERKADELILRLNDTEQNWDTWAPKKGDDVQVEDGHATTGKMYLDSVTYQSGLVTLRALSMPQNVKDKHSKSWEDVKLSQLFTEVANNHGLTVDKHDVEDHQYKYVQQNNESDFDFLYRRCSQEGLSFLVFDGKLVVYGEKETESKTPTETLTITPAYRYYYTDDSDSCYKKCEVTNGSVTGSFEAPTGDENKVLHRVIPHSITDVSEANRIAQNLLREANKNATRMIVYTDYMARNVAAGGTVTLKTKGAKSWDGTAFVTDVRHDYVYTRSKIWLRKPLEY